MSDQVKQSTNQQTGTHNENTQQTQAKQLTNKQQNELS